MLGEHLVDGGDREDPVDRVGQRLLGIDPLGARLQPKQRGHGLEVVLDPVVDLLGEHAAQRHPAVLERNGRLVGDRLEEAVVFGGERHVAIDDELADLVPLPPQRHPDGVSARAALRPRRLPVVEHDRRSGRVERGDRRLHDRLERLLEVERLGDRFGDRRERLELPHARLGGLVELRVLDRLRNLRRDCLEERLLAVGELPRLPRADVEGALELVLREDRDGEDRLVVLLAKVREPLEPGVEMGLRRDHHGLARGGRIARDPLADPHAGDVGVILDRRPVSRAEDELARPVVVEVHEARVGVERRGDLVRDELEHLLEVEARVHGLDRGREQAKVATEVVHGPNRGSRGRRRRGSGRQWSARS